VYVVVNENGWSLTRIKTDANRYFQFEWDLFIEKDSNVVCNYLGLHSNVGPRMPENTVNCGFPLTGRIYEVDLLVGMSFTLSKRVFDSLRFSTYFEGYGTEDGRF
jgi:hypothetical protein